MPVESCYRSHVPKSHSAHRAGLFCLSPVSTGNGWPVVGSRSRWPVRLLFPLELRVQFVCRKMRISLNGRHLAWSWQLNQWRSWLVLVTLAVLFGHLLLSQTNVLSPAPETLEDVPRRAKQGDRGLKMVAATSTGAFTSTPQAVPSLSSTEGQTDTLASPRETSPIRRRPHGKGEADLADYVGSTARPAWTRLETRFRMRNERLRRVCQLRNVVSEPVVHATYKNETKKDFAGQGIQLPGACPQLFQHLLRNVRAKLVSCS